MNKDSLTRTQLKMLKYIYDFVTQNHEFPSNSWLGKQLLIESPRVSNLKSELRNIGYLKGKYSRTTLTKKAEDFLQDNKNANSKTVISSYIPLGGEVSAGKGVLYDDLAVYLENISNTEELETVAIPQISKADSVIALKVRGVSMESAGIMDGDYVIVELIKEIWRIGEGQIIVARYLEASPDIDTNEYDDIDPYLIGFTLKVYRGEFEDNEKGKYYRLGKIRDYGNQNPFEIKAKVIQPVGKVIGVYRNYKE